MANPTDLSRAELISALVERDGTKCQFPGEEHELNFNGEGKEEVTIDHHKPQSWCLKNGWTVHEIWDLSNLRLFCKRHNALKGDRLPNPDGTLPPLPKETLGIFYTRADKSGRVDVCDTCESGRLLLEGEHCEICGSGPQPGTYPRYKQRSPKDCDHHIFHCWYCLVEKPELRTRAYEDVFGVS